MKHLVIALVVIAPFAGVGVLVIAFRWVNSTFRKLGEIIRRIEQTPLTKEARQLGRMDPRSWRVLGALDALQSLEAQLRKTETPAFEPKGVFMSSTVCLVAYFAALVIGNLDGVDYPGVIHYPLAYIVVTATLLIWIVTTVKKLESRLAPVLTQLLAAFSGGDRSEIDKAIEALEKLMR